MKIDPKLKEELKTILTNPIIANRQIVAKKYLVKRIAEGKKRLRIYSSYQLDTEEIDHFLLELGLKGKYSEVENILKDDILAGVVIELGSKIIDLTLNAKLKNLKKNLYDVS